MAAIPNARREMFARLLAAGGKTQLQCYVEAGFSENSGASAASALARDPLILERVQELLNLRQDRGIISEQEIDLNEIVTSDKIDEEWVLRQLQDLIKKAKDTGQLKVARDSITDVAAIKGIGAQNKPAGDAPPNDSVPRIGKIDITLIAAKIAENRNALDQLLDEAVDITPKPPEVPQLPDGNDGRGPESFSDAESDSGDGNELQGETP